MRAIRRVDPGLLAIVVVAALLVGWWCVQVTQWTVMTDELLYKKLAVEMWDRATLLPYVHGERYGQPAVLYPLMLAPLFGLFDDPTAFRLAHILNAAIMASAAIPAYLLTREVVRERLAALAVAALTVAVPYVVYATVLMTEVPGYPAFLWALLAMQRAVAEPSIRRDLVALIAIAAATLARTQFVVLLPVLLAGALVHQPAYAFANPGHVPRLRASGRAARAALRDHAALVIVALLAGVAGLGLGGTARDPLGRYGGLLERDLVPSGTGKALGEHAAVLTAGLGVLPVVAAGAWVAASLMRPRSRREHAFAVLIALVIPVMVFVAATFNLRLAGGVVQDRYAFYVVPLVFVAMLACLLNPRVPWLLLLFAGAATAWIVNRIPFEPSELPFFASPPAAFHRVLDGRSHQVGLEPTTVLMIAAVGGGVMLAIALARVPRGRLAGGVTVLVLAVVLAETLYLIPKTGIDEHPSRLDRGQQWVDALLPSAAVAGIAPGFIRDAETTRDAWWDVEFWNRTVQRQFAWEGAPAFLTVFPRQRLDLDWMTGEIRPSQPVRHLLVPARDRRFRAAGRALGRRNGVELVELAQPPRALWAVRGIDEVGWTPGGGVTRIKIYGSSPRPVRVAVAIHLAGTPDQRAARRADLGGGTSPVSVRVPAGGRVAAKTVVCVTRERPATLMLTIAGEGMLASGQRVGAGLEHVATRSLGRCAAQADSTSR